jgi:hypothetical protein
MSTYNSTHTFEKIHWAKIGAASTMYVPPKGLQNSDEDMIKQLGMVPIKIN